MSIIEELRREYNNLKEALDTGKSALAELIEVHETLGPDPEFDAIFVLKEAECNYFISEAEEKLEALNNEIALLEAQTRDN